MRLGKRERAAYTGKPSLFERDTLYRAKVDRLNTGPRMRSVWDNMHKHGRPLIDWSWLPRPHVANRRQSQRCFKPA